MRLRAFVVVAVLPWIAPVWADSSVKLTTGFFYANGQSNDLTAPNTTIKSVPVGVKVKNGRFGVRLSSGWLEVKSGDVTNSGQGDTTLSVSYDITENPWWTLTVKEKFATGDKNKGLSTGYNDTKVQVDYFRPMARKYSVFMTMGYTFKGGQSDNPNYQDAAYASLGGGVTLGKGWTGGISFDYNQATSTTLEDTFGGSLFLGHSLTRQVGVNVFAGYDSSDTVSAGIGLSYKLK